MILPVTDRFAAFIANADFAAISSKAVASAKLHILDTLGVALAAVSSPVGSIALEYSKRGGGTSEATVWGSTLRVPLPIAAFTNGLLAHAIDYDDWDAVVYVGHPSCMVVASALTVGETIGATGKDLLQGYVLGIEIATQIASGCPNNIHDRGFHSTPVYGSMGSVAAAASMMRLSADKVRAAFGIAASAASGLHRQQGSMVKPFHAANTARNGVEAALLADRGFTADEAIIENPRGFCDSFFGENSCNYEKMLQGLGDPYYLESPGLSFKLHPCSAPQFLAADATLDLVRQHNIRYNDVTSVEVRVGPTRYRRHYHAQVRSGLQGKFAINYVCAVAILDGRLERESFTDAKAADPEVQAALRKVNVVMDEAIPESKGEYCPVTITLKDGRKVQHTATIPKGHTKNPLTEDEVLEKFRSNAKTTISKEKAEALIARVFKLETLSDLGELTALLVP